MLALSNCSPSFRVDDTSDVHVIKRIKFVCLFVETRESEDVFDEIKQDIQQMHRHVSVKFISINPSSPSKLLDNYFISMRKSSSLI